jgi:hypothetical protein
MLTETAIRAAKPREKSFKRPIAKLGASNTATVERCAPEGARDAARRQAPVLIEGQRRIHETAVAREWRCKRRTRQGRCAL